MKKWPAFIKWVLSIALLFIILMSVMRLVTYFTFKAPQTTIAESARAFWYGFRYDARDVGILSLLLLILGSIPALHPFKTTAGKRVSLGLVFIYILLFIILYICDFLHYHYLQQRLNASALSFLEDAQISAGMVWQSYPVIRIVIGIIVAFIVLRWVVLKIYKSCKRGAQEQPKVAKGIRIVGFITCFLLFALAIFGRAGQFPLRWSDAFKLGSDFNANLALNPFQSFVSSFQFRSSGYNTAKVKQYYPFMASYLGVQHPDSTTLNFERYFPKNDSLPQLRPNIVLVICESFSAYKSSMWGNPLNSTPFFNELCGKGLFFDNCFTPHVGTARGVWATVTGLPDVELVKTASRNPAMVDQRSIINEFEGYQKFYFIGGSTSWANIRGLLSNNINGLHLYEQDNYDVPRVDVWGISDKNLFLQANKILAQQPNPFFAVIQTADNHRPYTIPQEDIGDFKKLELPQDSLKKYGFDSNDEYNAFRFTDYCFQKFITSASKEKYFENTIFAFVGDHGITGNAGNMLPAAWTQNALTSYHVPLLFYSPKLITPQRLHCIASQVDVLPTLAGLANISYYNHTLGRDLRAQYVRDSGANNIAFIINQNDRNLGAIKYPYYYSIQQDKHESMVWASFLQQGQDPNNQELLKQYSDITNAFYETTRYLLYNNKKKK